jgi:hypothetical protein
MMELCPMMAFLSLETSPRSRFAEKVPLAAIR